MRSGFGHGVEGHHIFGWAWGGHDVDMGTGIGRRRLDRDQGGSSRTGDPDGGSVNGKGQDRVEVSLTCTSENPA